MDLYNIRYLVVDVSTTCEDLLTGLPVLLHLYFDTRTSLETRTKSLHATNCSLDDSANLKTGKLGRIMIATLSRLQHNDAGGPAHPDKHRPNVNYRKACTEDVLPDPSFLSRIRRTSMTK